MARRYELLRELGTGSFGRVWLVRDLVGQRDVALKRIRADHVGDADVRRRLWREARAVARLEHPAVVRLFDYGEDEVRDPYVVMELVEGEPLSDAAAASEDARELADWLDQLLEALAYAHARGVVHRDLKPQNVLLTYGASGVGRRIKILDFGLARVEEDPEGSVSGAVGETVGTPVYMAPEQATQPASVGPAADLYAVGIMAWEMFCGAPPFMGSTGMATVLQHVRSPLPPFHPRAALAAPSGLGVALARALEKDPRRRYPDAATMRRTLRQLFSVGEGDDLDETLVNATPVGILGEPTASGAGTLSLFAGELPSSTRTTLTRPAEAPLYGREGWQRVLWGRVGEVATRQQPFMVLLGGAVGAGKHRLGRWLVETAAQTGYLTPLDLSTGAGDVRATDPLGAALRATLGLSAVPPVDPVAAVSAVLATLGADRAVDAAALSDRFWPAAGRPASPARRSHVVHELLRHVTSQRPVLLWLGRASQIGPVLAAALHELVTRAFEQGLALMTVVSVDDAPPPPWLAALTTRFAGQCERLMLGPLPPAATLALFARYLPDDPAELGYPAELQHLAGGNPLIAGQLVHLLWEVGAVYTEGVAPCWSPPLPGLPQTPAQVLAARLKGLLGHGADPADDPLGRLARTLAVLGQAFPVSLAERLATRLGHSPRAAAALVERLIDADLLSEHDSDGLSFRHPALRRALLDTVDETARRAAHHLCAEVLTATLGAGVEALCVHLHGAGLVDQAWQSLGDAIEDALRMGDTLTAEALLGCVDDGPSPDAAGERLSVLMRLRVLRVRLLLESGQPDAALRLLAGTPDGQVPAGDAERLRLRGEALLLVGDAVAAEPVLLQAQQALDRDLQAPLAAREAPARVRWLLGRCALHRGRLRAARTLLVSARSELAAHGDVLGELKARLDLSQLAEASGDPAAALRFAQDAAALTGDVADTPLTAEAALRVADLFRRMGQPHEAREAYALALRRFEGRGQRIGQARSSKGLAQMERRLGDHAESLKAYDRARTAYADAGDSLQAGQCDMHLGWIHTRAGELDRAEGCFLRALVALQSSEDALRLGLLHGFLARIAQYRGDRELRQRRLAEALRIDAGRGLAVPEWPRTLEVLADALIREGDPDEARGLLQRAAEVWRLLHATADEERCRRVLRELPPA